MSSPGRRTLLKDLQFLITSCLQVLPWLFLFTVHTRHNTPHARFCVIVQFFSFHYLSAIFVGTSNNFELAGFQVSLLQAIKYIKKKEKSDLLSLVKCWNPWRLEYIIVILGFYLFVPQFISPRTTVTWTFNHQRQNFPSCCIIRKNILKYKTKRN